MRLDYSPFFRSTVGFDRLLDLLESADTAQGYPPYNIERSDENNYRVTDRRRRLCRKGPRRRSRDGVLTVTGKREDAAKPAYLHQGIAGRAFERSFQLAEHVEVKGAKLENGLLHVDLERIVPEEKKPRRSRSMRRSSRPSKARKRLNQGLSIRTERVFSRTAKPLAGEDVCQRRLPRVADRWGQSRNQAEAAAANCIGSLAPVRSTSVMSASRRSASVRLA